MIASGLSYYRMTKWLEDVQYSIRIGAGIFVLTGLVTVVIALGAISFRAIRQHWEILAIRCFDRVTSGMDVERTQEKNRISTSNHLDVNHIFNSAGVQIPFRITYLP